MTSPLLPHARALLASPSTLTVAELDEALGVAQSVHSLRLTAAVAMVEACDIGEAAIGQIDTDRDDGLASNAFAASTRLATIRTEALK